MLREEVLREWNTLQALIKPFFENKALIIEAIEFHLHQASSFTTENSHEPLLNQREWTKQKADLTQQLATTQNESEQENLQREITQLEQALTNHNQVQQAFTNQKAKNEQIVRECQQLLAKLKGTNNHD